MKAAIISLGSISSQWTHEALKKYFASVDMLNLKDLEVRLGPEAGVYYKGQPLVHYDCVYVKGSFRYIQLLRGISTYLQKKSYIPIEPQAFTTIHNKLLTHIELQKHSIPMPRTYITPGIDEAKALLKNLNYPVVMKFPEGTQGKGVMFADSYSSASAILDALQALHQPFMIQEYLDSGEVDIRAFVVGDDVVASMMRVASKAELRANIHAGGEGKPYVLEGQERKVAIAAAKALGAGICGVDIIKGPKGPLVVEVNISPGLQGITEASNVNVADKIAKFLYDKTVEFLGHKKNVEAQHIIDEKLKESNEIITNLNFRGDHIVLPSVVTKVAEFKEEKEYKLKVEKGKVLIEEFKVKRG